MLYVLEFITFIVIAFLAITQIVIPILTGMPLFPVFRFRKALVKLDDAKAEAFADALEQEIVNTHKQTETK
jgi:hypothetical protein